MAALLTPLEAELVRLFVQWHGQLAVDRLFEGVEFMEITADGGTSGYSKETRPRFAGSEPILYFRTHFGPANSDPPSLPTCIRIAVAGTRLVEIEITTTTDPIDPMNDKIVIEGYEPW